ncbi:unnamed protein product [Parajaminaea phylloscopi]
MRARLRSLAETVRREAFRGTGISSGPSRRATLSSSALAESLRLSTSSLPHVRPWYRNQDADPRASRELAVRLSTLLSLTEPGSQATSSDILQAYHDVVEIDENSLSATHIAQLIDALRARPSRPVYNALAVVRSALAHVQESEQHSSDLGARRKREILGSPRIQTALLELVGRSHRKPSGRHLQEALQLLEVGQELQKTSDGSPQIKGSLGGTWNAFLNLLVKTASPATAGQDPINAGDSAAEQSPTRSSPYKGLAQLPTQNKEAVFGSRSSIQAAASLFYEVWHDMLSARETRLRPNHKTFYHRIGLEAKLTQATTCSMVRGGEHSARAFDWTRLQTAYRESVEAGLANVSHVNKIMHEYSRLRRTVELILDRDSASNTSESKSSLAEQILAVNGQRPHTLIRETYEALRWNSVRLEMAQLRDSMSSELSSPSPLTNEAGSALSLLGAALPASLQPDMGTYFIMIAHHAIVEGDYQATMNVIQDFQESERTRDATLKPQLSNSMYHTIFKGFALHGVPFAFYPDKSGLAWSHSASSDGASMGSWRAVDTVVASDHPKYDWNIVNLLTFIEEYLEAPLAPVPAASWAQASVHVASTSRPSHSEDGQPQRKQFVRCPSPDHLYFMITALRRCMGDAHDDKVLEVMARVRAKFEFEPSTIRSDEPQTASRVRRHQNHLPEWKLDNRMQRLMAFLETRLAERTHPGRM